MMRRGLSDMNIDFSSLLPYIPLFLQGLLVTIIFSILTVIFGLVIGIPVSLLRISPKKYLSIPARAYIEVIRGTPSLLQLFLIAYGIPIAFGINVPIYLAGVLALSINSSAYVAEIIRAGIQAVDKGQLEAARSLGLSYGQAMRKVIIPQAIKNVLPAIGNEFVAIVKESSIVSIIGITDLMRITNIMKSQTFRIFEALMFAAILYFAVTFTVSSLMRKLEKRLAKNA